MTLEPRATRAVERAGPGDAPAVAEVLRDSFRDYPVMRFVLGDSPGYEERLGILIEMFVMARVFRREPILVIRSAGALDAAATLSDPAGPASPTAFARLREEVWAALGRDARQRYEAFGEATRLLTVPEPHLHLNMLGARPHLRGRGLSTRLLAEVHRIARETPGAVGVTLTTEDPANLPLYAHFGYRVIGQGAVDEALVTWGLFRPN